MSCKYFYTVSRTFQRRAYSNPRNIPIVYIPPGSNIFSFGTPSETKTPLLHDFGWSIEQGEAWAVVSGSGGKKGAVFKTLLGHTRVVPPSLEIHDHWAENGGLYPYFAISSEDPYSRIAYVSFRQRSGADSGAFFDYTTRYGAVRDEADRITLRGTLCPSGEELTLDQHNLLERLEKDMGLASLMDLPIVTLSSGQTRRARIIKAILGQPEILLLDEPLTGLDPPSRNALNNVLQELHQRSSPRMILGLRNCEEIPTWVTHVLELNDGIATTSRRNDALPPPCHIINGKTRSCRSLIHLEDDRKPVVDLKNVNVTYGDCSILKNIDWKIRQGERWHLRGSNGSGKTTLLALLTGDHPQSFVQEHLLLPSFSTSVQNLTLLPRCKIPTAHLRRLIGMISPEMFDAFPRRHPGMSVWEVITTGFDGGFVPRTRDASLHARKIGGLEWVDVNDEEIDLPVSPIQLLKESGREERKEKLRQWRISRCWEVLQCMGPASWTTGIPLSPPSELTRTRAFAMLPFSSLSPGEQRLVLLMRALVGRPPLVLLDEAWSGMDDNMIAAVGHYLRGEASGVDSNGHICVLKGVDDTQAVVVVNHWKEEVPWQCNEIRLFDL